MQNLQTWINQMSWEKYMDTEKEEVQTGRIATGNYGNKLI